MTHYLSMEEVLFINGRVLGGEPLLRDAGLLESAMARPLASAFGEDAYATLFEKAAALLHSLCRNHAFVDGNKRTATIVTILFLERNGWAVQWQQEEALHFILAVAQGNHNITAIAGWLEGNCSQIE